MVWGSVGRSLRGKSASPPTQHSAVIQHTTCATLRARPRAPRAPKVPLPHPHPHPHSRSKEA
eukprot:scaffold38621_cov81-Phaeocystis_antarctica.AAC.2